MVSEESIPTFKYNHDLWEAQYHTQNASLSPKKSSKRQLLKTRKNPLGKKPADKPLVLKSKPDLFPGHVHVSRDLQVWSDPSATRLQLANLEIPMVAAIDKSDVWLQQMPFNPVDPFLMRERPSDSIVKHCQFLLNQSQAQDRNRIGIFIKGYGVLDGNGVRVLKRFCEIAEMRKEVRNEEVWLAKDDGMSEEELSSIKSAL